MDIDERMRTLLAECRWVRDAALATALVPGLPTHAPPLVALPTGDGDVLPAIPVTCLDLLADPVAAVISDAVQQGVSGQPLQAVESLEAPALRDDPLTAVLTDLIAQAALPGLRADVVPLLGVAWITQRMVAGHLDGIPGLSPTGRDTARQLAAALAGLPPAERGTCLRGVGFALASRLGAAANMAAMAGATVQLGGLYRQLLPDPLVLAFPRGTLDEGRELDAAAAMLGLDIPAAVLADAPKVAAAAFAASQARADAGKLEPVDAAVTHHFPEGADPELAAFHPFAGPALIGLAPLLAGKALSSAGLSKAAAKAYGSQRGARALAGLWRPFAKALGVWDLLSRMVSMVVPLRIEAGRAISSQGRLPLDARWPLLVPRPNADATLGAVAAVRLGEVLSGVRVALGGRSWAWWSVVQAFHSACRASGASVRQLVGDVGVAAFPAPEHALRFADRIREALGPGATIAVDAEGQDLRIPETASLGVGLSMGVIEGGTDGETSVLRGHAVAEAIHLAGNGRAEAVSQDPLAVRSAGWGQDGLHNHGLVASDTFLRSMIERIRKRGGALHVRNEGGAAGGVDEDFACYAVRAWWQDGEALRVAVLFGGPDADSGGAAELRTMDPDALAAWRSSDRIQARSQRSLAPAPAAPAFADGGYGGELDSPSKSFFGLDEDSPTPAPPPAPPRDVFASVSDFGERSDPGPGLHDFALDERDAQPADDGVPAAPLMMLPDDEDDEDTGAFEAVGVDEEDDFDDEEDAGFAIVDEDPAQDGADPFAGATATQAFPQAPSEAPPLMMLDPEADEDEPSSAMGFALVDDDGSGAGLPDGPVLSMLDDEDGGFPEGPALAMMEDEDEVAPPATEAWDDPFAAPPAPSAGQEGYDGELELVGVAGFSLVDEPAADTATEGADPFFDPEEFTGFYDRRVGEVGGAPPAPAPAPASGGGGGAGMVEEVARLLKGYVVVEDGDCFTFGLPDGALLRDAQTHDTAGDIEAAYLAFLQGKIQEGFVPRADRVVALVQGARPQPVDTERLKAAYGAFQ